MTDRIRRYFPATLVLILGMALVAHRFHMAYSDGAGSDIDKITATPRSDFTKLVKPSKSIETLSVLPAGIEVETFSSYYPDQIILRFPDDKSYARILNGVGKSPVRLLRQIDALRAIRLGYEDWIDVSNLLKSAEVSSLNPLISRPSIGRPIPGIGDSALAFRNTVVSWLGIESDTSRLGRGVKIAVIDTGIVPHPELPALYRSIAIEPFPQDMAATHPHGTSVASLISGKGPNASGLAPAAQLISIRAMDDSGCTDGFNVSAAILLAVDEGAQIINLSLGSASETSLERDAIAIAREKGIIIVAGAGNDGHDQLLYPAGYPGVISVGALDAGGERMVFSNVGDGLTITAPGYGVSAAAPGGNYIHFSGTSASAPIVAGALAAIMSDGTGRSVSADDAVKILLENTDDIGLPGHDSEYGYGILNMNRILNRNIPGIFDAAITHTRLNSSVNGGIPDQVEITVQNRGTSTLINAEVAITTQAGTSTKYVTLPARAIESFIAPINSVSPAAVSNFQVDARISLSSAVQDITPDNNFCSSLFSPNGS